MLTVGILDGDREQFLERRPAAMIVGCRQRLVRALDTADAHRPATLVPVRTDVRAATGDLVIGSLLAARSRHRGRSTYSKQPALPAPSPNTSDAAPAPEMRARAIRPGS